MEDREYCLDIGDDSYSTIFYTSEKSTALPFFSYCSGRYICFKDYFTINRKLDGYLLLYSNDGEGVLEMNHKTYVLGKSSAVLIDCRHPHSYHTSKQPWDLYWLRFSGTAAPLYYDMITTPSFHVMNYKNPHNIKTCMERNMNLSFIQGIKSSFIQNKIITDLLTDLWLNNKEVQKPLDSFFSATIQAVNRYIKNNYKNEITIDLIASHVHLSPYYLSRLYKNCTGATLHEFLLTYRINLAKDLLLHSDKQIQEIGFEVGFTNTNSFIRCFNKQMQMSPLTYRNMMMLGG